MTRIAPFITFLITWVLFRPGYVHATPEISVEQPTGTALVDGAATVAFGNADVDGFGVFKTFRIRNTGTSTLSGIVVSIDGADAGSFVVNTAPAASVGAGGQTRMALR